MREHLRIPSSAWLALGLSALLAGPSPARAQPDPSTDRPAARPGKAADFPDDAPPPTPGGLRMSRAVVCREIHGFENYKPLRGAAQTSEEKLLIYYRPLRYTVDYVDGFYRAHLVQDNEIRKKGEKKVIRQKRKVVEFAPKTREPFGPFYIKNSISLKGLPPGDYELTITLRDELDKGGPPSRQVVKFKVIPPIDPKAKGAGLKAEGPPPAP